MILLVCCCHRFPHQGKPLPNSLPLIRHMLEDQIKNRFDQVSVNGFERGIFMSQGFSLTSQYVDWCRTRAHAVEDDDYKVEKD